MKFVSISLLLICLTIDPDVHAQIYFPGQSHLDSTAHIEYIAGNLPIIISAAHGGYREPDSIAIRDCADCSILRDAFTQELTRDLSENIYLKTGCHPHVIINLLHRNRLDANREIAEAADGDATAMKAWRAFHRFIELAKDTISKNNGRGIFYDIHGHGHSIQRIELGYTLNKNDLQMSDNQLNIEAILSKSSIKLLAKDNRQGLNHSELLRGNQSLGSLLEDIEVPAVPSSEQSFPLDQEDYFSGGYNTARHGSRDGGLIDAIQIECNHDIRFDEATRIAFADSLSAVLLEYTKRHYDEQFDQQYCLSTYTNDLYIEDPRIHLYPNPTNGLIQIITEQQVETITLTDCMGKSFSLLQTNSYLDLSTLARGIYFLSFCIDKKHYTKRIVRY